MNRFSIILPLFSRENHTYRFLEFLNENKPQFDIVLADGLDEGLPDRLKTQFSELNLKSISYKQSKKFLDFYNMIYQAISIVDTEYVMLVDNDDFIIQSSLNSLIDFLDNNQDYCSAGFEIAQFQIDNFSSKTYGSKTSFSRRYYYKREDEPYRDIKQNLQEVFLNFQPNFYNVFRTNSLKLVWKELCELNFSDLTIAEFYIMLRILSLGRQKTFLHSTHYLRQSGTGISENYNFFDALIDNNVPEDIRLLEKKINHIFNLNSDKSISDAYKKYLRVFLASRINSNNPLVNKLKSRIRNLGILVNLNSKIKEFQFARRFLNNKNLLKDSLKLEIFKIKKFLAK